MQPFRNDDYVTHNADLFCSEVQLPVFPDIQRMTESWILYCQIRFVTFRWQTVPRTTRNCEWLTTVFRKQRFVTDHKRHIAALCHLCVSWSWHALNDQPIRLLQCRTWRATWPTWWVVGIVAMVNSEQRQVWFCSVAECCFVALTAMSRYFQSVNS